MPGNRIELDDYLGQAFHRMPVAMIVVNQRGQITRLNQLAETTFGYEASELIGQPVEALIPQRFRAAHPHYRQGFLAETSARPMGLGRDLSGLRKDGSEFPVEIGINPVETDEGPMILSVILDLSERKQAEKRIQDALTQKDLLLRNFARVDFQRFLDELLPSLTESYRSVAGLVSIAIDAHEVKLPINEAIPCGLVINELVSNALKHGFTQGRGGQITVSVQQHGERTIELSVSNDGHAIPDTLDLEQTTTLGLQLVQLLTRQLNGSLDIQRANPTRFTLRFDLEAEA